MGCVCVCVCVVVVIVFPRHINNGPTIPSMNDMREWPATAAHHWSSLSSTELAGRTGGWEGHESILNGREK